MILLVAIHMHGYSLLYACTMRMWSYTLYAHLVFVVDQLLCCVYSLWVWLSHRVARHSCTGSPHRANLWYSVCFHHDSGYPLLCRSWNVCSMFCNASCLVSL